METEDERGPININRIAVKAPPFWPEEPELWFAQIEGQFTLGGITQDATKYTYVLSQLEAKCARKIKNVAANPPESNKYHALKQSLTQRLSASQEHPITLETRRVGRQEILTIPLPSLNTCWHNRIRSTLSKLWLERLPFQMT